MRRTKIIFLSLFITFCSALNAQHVSMSTNLLDWAALGSTNLSVGVSVSRHFSLEVGGVYNPHSITKESGLLVQNKQKTGYAGVKYWPWYVFSGWWVGAKAQYSDFSRTGIWRYALEEAKAVGGGLSFGYTLLLTKRLNLDMGLGVWGGKKLERTLYHCPDCMKIRESGPELFIAPDMISLSLMYVF